MLLIFSAQGCASKRLAKQAQRLEDAGLYELAAESYLQSFNRNQKNIDAATGLRRTGQRTLDMKAAAVSQAYNSGNDRETIYKYLDAQAYHRKIRNIGIQLSIPPQAQTYYEEAKPRFLDSSFEEARLLLEEENFSQAESIFSEIKRIDPDYRDLSQYMRVSRGEPVYRLGVEQLDNGFYRRAYNTFTTLINNQGTYKDATELREDALSRGRITIGIAEFDNRSGQRNAHEIIRSRINAEISGLNNPFIQIVDDKNTGIFLKEQQRAASTGSEMKIGHLMATRAILTGTLLNLDIRQGRLQRTVRRAYLREVIETEDDSGEKSRQTLYHKVTYNEYQRENSAAGAFQFQLSSTETGAVLTSGVVELKPADRIHYAAFDGNVKNLVPGHWEYKDRTSPRDNILDDPARVRNLQSLFSARQTIKSPAVLRNEIIEEIASEVGRALNNYNPEQ